METFEDIEEGGVIEENKNDETDRVVTEEEDEEEMKRGLKMEFKDQIEFYEGFGLTHSESESLARTGYFLVPFDITEDRCKELTNRMQAVRKHYYKQPLLSRRQDEPRNK